MRKLRDDLNMPLSKVERRWLRIPLTVIISLIMIPLTIIGTFGLSIGAGIYDVWNEFTEPCLKGPK